ncbi:hypothetical protein AB434_4007 [Heyndrickxia coagulans]|uniref:Uncharacterized protein n=1 Tax=Heyndrickxia coagulans TaxID=1398 RepID=A0AAN0T6P3_HEYCO|nr:hypothetical protein SB48_HM08orf01932 [Heyndrickxia coagulans]AKN56412.1 hypothetical protein AB434_4007 [Heyndrickxia coagulans]
MYGFRHDAHKRFMNLTIICSRANGTAPFLKQEPARIEAGSGH